VPRAFEHTFFRDDLLVPLHAHYQAHTSTILIRITDFLAAKYTTVGTLLGLAPTHHIIMENLLIGKSSSNSKWETYDLKPTSYFFPERDIADGRLTSQETKSKLADKFNDKIVLTRPKADAFLTQLKTDTALLSANNAVDYSLFLVRIANDSNAPSSPTEPPFAPPSPPTWRTGIKSQDGKYIFRAAILDFFWAKHKTQAKMMTWLIKAWNLIDRQGPMSITTTPDEYRERFLKMCQDMIEVKD